MGEWFASGSRLNRKSCKVSPLLSLGKWVQKYEIEGCSFRKGIVLTSCAKCRRVDFSIQSRSLYLFTRGWRWRGGEKMAHQY